MRPRKPHSSAPLPSRVRVWDAPTRLFHWSIVLLVACSWYSADRGLMTVHLCSGLTLLTLLLFRIAWGFFGSTTARFSDFLRPPPVVLSYFKSLLGEHKPAYAGHNPAGGLMVAGLMSILLTQAATGLFSNDGVKFQGPLALWVSSTLSDRITEFHGLLFNVILLMVWMHVVAVFFYLFVKGENLVKPMVTGYKSAAHVPPKLNLRFTHWGVALRLLAAAAGAVGAILLL